MRDRTPFGPRGIIIVDTVNIMSMLTASTMSDHSISKCSVLLLALCLGVAPAPEAAELTVRILAPEDAGGQVACSVHSEAAGFPESGPKELRRTAPWAPGGVTLVFTNLVAGRIAVAASLDRNENGRLDKGLFGIPKEEWGVSGGARPAMRAPRFEEAAFVLPEGTNTHIEIRLKR